MAVCNSPQQVMTQISPAPDPVEAEKKKKKHHHHHHKHQNPDDGDDRRKDPKEGWLLPRLEFTANDLGCAGSCKFMDCGINCHALVHDAVVSVLRRLYLSPEHQPHQYVSSFLWGKESSGVDAETPAVRKPLR